MKTTVDIPAPLLREAKRLAARERTTLRALVEEGLRSVLKARARRTGFTLRRASVRGDGLVVGCSLRDWDAVRDAIYAEHGA